ncbi:MAG: hypothetical protein RLZZ126_462 [Pseudomonadota bacterium]|jgi:hypothetical protein
MRRLMLNCLAASLAVSALPARPSAQRDRQEGPLAPGFIKRGQARLKVFGFSIYDATLWTEPGFSATRYAEHTFALELQYWRTFSGDSIARRALDEMRLQADLAPSTGQRWLTTMLGLFPDVQPRDRLMGLHQPVGATRFVFNGQVLGHVEDTEFARLFFGIWLSPKTSQPGMRSELLGETSVGPAS